MNMNFIKPHGLTCREVFTIIQ